MEQICCQIIEIIYENTDNGYVICMAYNEEENDFTAVGCMPYITVGDRLNLFGTWVTHMEYGRQLKVEYYERLPMEGEEDVLLFLSSGAIKGIKEKTAKKIIHEFGGDALDIILNEPTKLSRISGISMDRAYAIHKSYQEHQRIMHTMTYFTKWGIATSIAYKAYQVFGESAVTRVEDNPYILSRRVEGIGFKTADKIAFSMGHDQYSPHRIEAGVCHILHTQAANGHTYYPVDSLYQQASGMLSVEKEQVYNALVQLTVDGDIRLKKLPQHDAAYLPNLYTAEMTAARLLKGLCGSVFELENLDFDRVVSNLEKINHVTLTNNQKQAALYAMTRGVMVLTGGPGTGKTTTVRTILQLMEKQKLSIALCAPTGRASKRLGEVSGAEAKTVHRMLGMEYSRDQNGWIFHHNEDNPLPEDVIIVDEMSMVDITLFHSLLRAIKSGGRLIMVGDSDQLPSVGAGNVLGDIIASDQLPVIQLREIFRQAEQSSIVVNAHKINKGEYPSLKNGKDSDFFFIERRPMDGMQEIMNLIFSRLPAFLGVTPLDNIQVLTPVRRGEMGVENLNKCLQQVFNPPEEGKKEIKRMHIIFRVGDKIMQNRNNYDLEWSIEETLGSGIYNGDIGFIRHIDSRNKIIQIVFDGDKIVQYPFELLEDLELAYALTVHKSQGNEFPAIIMPMYPVNKMLLSRNLLYTAVTRAQRLAVLVGMPDVMHEMIDNDYKAERYSNLCDLLKKY